MQQQVSIVALMVGVLGALFMVDPLGPDRRPDPVSSLPLGTLLAVCVAVSAVWMVLSQRVAWLRSLTSPALLPPTHTRPPLTALALVPLTWAALPAATSLSHAALSAAPAVAASPNMALPLGLLSALLLPAWLTPFLLPPYAAASVPPAAAFIAVLAGAKAALLACLLTGSESLAFAAGSAACLILAAAAWRAGAVNYLFGLVSVASRGNMATAFAHLVASIRRVCATFMVLEIGALYFAAVSIAHALGRSSSGAWAADGAAGAAGAAAPSSVAGLIRSTWYLDLVVNAWCATPLRFGGLLAGLAVAANGWYALVSTVFVPWSLLAAAAEGVEFPFLNAAHRASTMGFSLMWSAVFFRPYTYPDAPALVLWTATMLGGVYTLNVLSATGEIASAALMLMASSPESWVSHARVLAFFALASAANAAVLAMFVGAVGSSMMDGLFAVAGLYLLDVCVRSLVRLIKSFALYVIHHRSAPAVTDTYVFYTEFGANSLEIAVKGLVIAGHMSAAVSSGGGGGSSNGIFIMMYAYNTYTSMMANWAAYKRRRAAAAEFDARIPDATADDIAAYDDVCAFCWDDMAVGEAKVTPCGHIFHAGCLQKWLYINDVCPKCRTVVLDTAGGPPAGH